MKNMTAFIAGILVAIIGFFVYQRYFKRNTTIHHDWRHKTGRIRL